MSHAANVHAHALYLRARAAALRNGDAEAREHAQHLEDEANEIDPQPQPEEVAC